MQLLYVKVTNKCVSYVPIWKLQDFYENLSGTAFIGTKTKEKN